MLFSFLIMNIGMSLPMNRLEKCNISCFEKQGPTALSESSFDVTQSCIKYSEYVVNVKQYTHNLNVAYNAGRNDLTKIKFKNKIVETKGQNRFKIFSDIVLPQPCKNLNSFGQGDDLKFICGNELFKRINSNADSDCVIISLGSNNQWEFEKDVFKNTNCKIEVFDCTIAGRIPPKIASRTRYHQICVGAIDEVKDFNF